MRLSFTPRFYFTLDIMIVRNLNNLRSHIGDEVLESWFCLPN